MTPILRIENLHHIYQPESDAPITALRNVDLCVREGEYLVILGHNGSGKSTLAKHLNALLLPTEGDVWVNGWNTRDADHMLDIRSTVGMVFQTPDNQIVATIVEEDVAFGPENLGVPHDEMVQRVNWSLDQVGMQAHRLRPPHLLSGGQKQRICIAGVLAMQPRVLVLDEATAMLDPLGRQEVLDVAQKLNREQGVTVVAVTHFMREAVYADRVVILSEGEVALEGTPRELFRQVDRLRELHLDVPQTTELAYRLHRQYPSFPTDILTIDEMYAALDSQGLHSDARGRLEEHDVPSAPSVPSVRSSNPDLPTGEPVISARNLAHDYMRGTPMEVRALHDVNMSIRSGDIIGLMGHTGSGKSTLIQHFNGLLSAHAGSLHVMGHDLSPARADLNEMRAVRRQVGLLFQFPEAQLFERYVGDDVAYGPRNLNLSKEEVRERVRNAMESVGLGFEAYKDRVTFVLSGGERRRVALAGVLAMEPKALVLDEPTAGLDPQGRRQIIHLIKRLHEEGLTLVLVSHNMEELAELCDRLYVIANGETVLEGSPAHVFGQPAKLRAMGLEAPAVTLLFERLIAQGKLPATQTVYTVDQAERALITWLDNAEGL